MALRLFAALDLPDDVAERLGAIQRGVPGARWSPRESLHLTLRFFGEVAETVADDLDVGLEQAALSSRAFDLRLKGAGFFGGQAPHALYVGVAESPALLALASAAERAARGAGLKPEPRKYLPHVTLAYLTRADLERVMAFARNYALFESRSWRVERFALYSSWQRKSASNLYRFEADYPLQD